MLNRMRSAVGMYKGTLTTADFSGFCRSAGEKGISVYAFQFLDQMTYSFLFYRRDLKALRDLTNKRGDQLKFYRYPGLYWSVKRLQKRPILVTGLALLLFLFLYLPGKVLFVRVSGNSEVPEQRILEAAAQAGVRFFADRKQLRSEEIKNNLLQQIPQLAWTGLNTHGCIAEISVREHRKENPRVAAPVYSIMEAERDGIIEKCTVRKGILQCKPGQAVKQGDLLISGLEDTEKTMKSGQVDGEIFALTVRKLKTVTPSQYLICGETLKRQHRVGLIVGKKHIKLWSDSGNPDASCGRMYEEYYITLPGGYQLPLALTVDTYEKRKLLASEIYGNDIAEGLKASAELFLKEDMIAGTILRKKEAFREENGVYSLWGNYLCHEMIGRFRQEQIGVKQDTWNES